MKGLEVAATAMLAAVLGACAGDLAPVNHAEDHRPDPGMNPTTAAPGRVRVPDSVVFVPEIPPAFDPRPAEPEGEVAIDVVGEEFLPPIPLEGGEEGAEFVEFAPEEDPGEAPCVEVFVASPPPVEVVEVHTYEVEEAPATSVTWVGFPYYVVQGSAPASCGRSPVPQPDPCAAPCPEDPAVVVVSDDPPRAPPAPRPRWSRPRREAPPAADPPREDPPARPHRPAPVRRESEPAAAIQRPTVETYTGARLPAFRSPPAPAADPRFDPPSAPAPAPVARHEPDTGTEDHGDRREAREERREQRQEAREERREERREQRQEPRQEQNREPERAAAIRQPDPPAPPPPPPERHHGRRGKD